MTVTTRLCIKIFHLEYYFSPPIDRIDQCYSELRGCYAHKLPVIRLYGTTQSGQKVCANIHGYLPYMFAAIPNSLASSLSDDFIREFCGNLEKSLRLKTKSFAPDEPIVFDAHFVKARSIYGYSESDDVFLKIHLLDPSLVGDCADILLNDSVMTRHFYPFETHLPFLLKFLIDYNLYGMNYLYAKHFRVRSDNDVFVNVSMWRDDTFVCVDSLLTGEQLFPSDVAPRHTSTGIEVDISACDITNREELTDASGVNPGLEALWTEERFRRTCGQFGSDLPDLPSPDELLPLFRQDAISRSESDLYWLEQWAELCDRVSDETGTSVSTTHQLLADVESADDVTEWLKLSQKDADSSASCSPPTNFRPHLIRSVSDATSTTHNYLSHSGCDDLLRLASLTEETDAILSSGAAGHIAAVLQSSSDLQHWTPLETSLFHGTHDDSIALERSPSRLSTLVEHPPSSVQSNESGTLVDEAALLVHARRSAIEHVLGQSQLSVDLTTEYSDDHNMSQLIEVDACEWQPDDAGWSSPYPSTSPPNRSEPTYDASLERIDEMDEPHQPSPDVFNVPDLLSPWSSPLSNGLSPLPVEEQLYQSQSLFDSMLLPDSDHTPTQDNRRLFQLDGTDDSLADSKPTPRKRPPVRRRRLGLRLTGNVHPKVSPQLETRQLESAAREFCTMPVVHSGHVDFRSSASQMSVAVQGDEKLLSAPIVLVDRLPVNHDLQPMHTEEALPTQVRLSPRDDFEDISNERHTESSAGLSFHDTVPSSPLSRSDSHNDLLDATLGPLSLLSQTQQSFQSLCQSPSPIVSSSPEPLPISFPVQSDFVYFWRPSRTPPCPSVVEGRRNDFEIPNQDVVHRSSDEQLDLEIGDSLTNSDTVNPPVSQQLTTIAEASEKHESSFNNRPSSVASVSLLYQGASQRCFLPVQVDHTTVASLELHCRSRPSSLSVRPSRSEQSSLSTVIPPACSVGLLPDPSFDPILIACLTLQHTDMNLIVLINRAALPLSTADNSNATDSINFCPSHVRLGLTNYLVNKVGTFRNHPKVDCHPKARFLWCRDEWTVLNWITYLVQKFDPDILVGYDVDRFSWGYLVERATQLGRQSYSRELSRLAPDIHNCPCCKFLIECCGIFSNSCSGSLHLDERTITDVRLSLCTCVCRPVDRLSARPPTKASAWPAGPGAGRTGGPFACPGRLVLSLWRLLMSELGLFEYSVETVISHLFKITVPKFTWSQLQVWFDDSAGANRWRTIDYWGYRSLANLWIMSAIDLIGRTSEFARIFGIEFFHVLSRGSQYRVESLFCRIAHQANYLLASPSISQRARQRAPEAIPLNMEPDSQLFVDGPVAVLDFQSLYPSIVIAYNYCYSTVLGRFSELRKCTNHAFDLGCLTHFVPAGMIQLLGPNVNISPNGVVFVNSSVLEGILPRMLRQLLRTRLMVKDSIRLYKKDRSLTRLLDARQLGLKLMANVIFGYTAASFSGRMPCVEIADSIVQKSRETLEKSIELVESGEISLPASCDGLARPRVVYGDTDSLFVHLPGYGRREAFDAAQSIADEITKRNPAPIKLKLEKIYYPCLLEARKRYVGYAYESVLQSDPIFDAKGIETVRRDSCPFVGKVLEETLRQLFDAFSWPFSSLDTKTTNGLIDANVRRETAEMCIRDMIRNCATRLMHAQVPFADCLLTRPYWGQSSYRPGAFAPALQVARRLLARDPRAEPLVGERVVYYVAPGRPAQTIISCVRGVSELYPLSHSPSTHFTSRRSLAPRLNLTYYLDKQLLPPLERMAEVLGWRIQQWLSDLPRHASSVSFQYKISADPLTGRSPCSLNRLGSVGSPSSSLCRSSSVRSPVRKRQSQLMRSFFGRPVCVCHSCSRHVPSNASVSEPFVFCNSCLSGNNRLLMIGSVSLGFKLNEISRQLAEVERRCSACVGIRGSSCEATCLCVNFHCPNHSRRLIATMRLAHLWTQYAYDLPILDSTSSWW